MNPPDLTFNLPFEPFTPVTCLNYKQTNKDGSVYPTREGEESDRVVFRIYNNLALNPSVITADNIRITTYDGIGLASMTSGQSLVSQQWMRMYEQFYGESTPLGVYKFTTYLDTDTAVGGAVSRYKPKYGSDRATSGIRAGSDTNGYGFIELTSYLEVPYGTGMGDYNFVITVEYDYVP